MRISYSKLWKILDARKMTAKDLSRRADISATTIRNMARNQNVSLEVLGKICAALRVDIGDIASFTDN